MAGLLESYMNVLLCDCLLRVSGGKSENWSWVERCSC